MSNPNSTGKELVPVAYATNARPLAMIDPTKQMRQKNPPRKRTMDPSSIGIEDRSSSPSPRKKEAAMKRKASELAAEDGTDKTSSPTPLKKVTPTKSKKLNTAKIKITDRGKKPETEKVYERNRKRPNRECEGLIDLQTPAKRVTRSAEALQKMQRGNDSGGKKIDKQKVQRKTVEELPTEEQQEREDKGFKRKTRSQGQGKPKVNKNEKGNEEEEEWNGDEGDEEEKGKGKNRHKSKGFKGKEVKGKQGKKEPGVSNNPQETKGEKKVKEHITVNNGNVAYFPCTIWTILHNTKSDMRTVLLDPKLHQVYENVRQHGKNYYWYLVFPMNGNGDKPLKITPYHWTVLVFDVRKKNWVHYNSLKKRDGRDPMLKDATVVKKYVEKYMKDRHAELNNQSTGTEILFEEHNFDAPICSAQNAPQQENTSVDCGVIVCMILDLLRHIEPIPKTLPKTEIDMFRAGLVSRFLNDEGRSWTIKKWEARRMGKGMR